MIETDDYDEFMEWYENEHALCPKCGCSEYMTTLAKWLVDFNNLAAFKDRNTCTCSDCGDKHIHHDRVKTINDIEE